MVMERRIMGMETEYALVHFPPPGSSNKPMTGTELFEIMNVNVDRTGVPRLYEEKYYPESRGEPFSSYEERRRYSMKKNRMFLGNGARFYLDTGDHPEYATPECLSALDLVAYDMAGEHFVEKLGRIVEDKLATLDIGGKVLLCKNNIDIRGNTFGCHENYLIPRRSPLHNESSFFKLVIRELIPFLISRQLYCGAGKIISGNKLGFQISQRADFIDSELSSDTTFRRGIINSRDEPLSKIDQYRRLHILIGDSTLSPLCTFLKVGTTTLMLRLIEEGALNTSMHVEDPILALREISADPTCSIKVKMISGDYLSALEIQKYYLEKAEKFFESRETDAETDLILKEWRRVLETLATTPEKLRYQIDWLGKQAIINRMLERFETSFQRLNKWVYLIKRIKSLKLERPLLQHHQKNPDLDIEEFLETRINKGDFIELKRHVRYNDININDFFTMHGIYHNLLKMDFNFHDIDSRRGVYKRMRAGAKGVDSFLPDDFDSQIGDAMYNPPANTRAKIRSRFIRAVLQNNAKGSVNWDSVSLHGVKLHKVNLMDPFASESPEVEALIRDIKQYAHLGD